MRINTLHLKDFRSHQDTKIELDRFTFITGENAAGKSSIAMAVQMLLTGKCSITDERGAGSEDLIRLGAHKFYISGQIGKTLIERSKGPSGHVIDIAGKSGPVPAMQAKIYEGVGVSADVLSAVLDSSRFIHMVEVEQKKLLAQILATDKIQIPESIRDDSFAINGARCAQFAESATEIDSWYKEVYIQRSETNRDLKALGIVEPPVIPEDAPDYKTIWKRLDDLRNELTRTTSERARAEERYDSAVKTAQERRDDLERRKKLSDLNLLPDADAADLQRILDGQEKQDSLRIKIHAIKKSISTKESELGQEKAGKIAGLRQKLKDVERQMQEKEAQIAAILEIRSAECPSCQRALPAKEKAALGTRLEDELEILNKQHKTIQAEFEQANTLTIPDNDELQKLRKSLTKLETELDAMGDIIQAESKMRVHREAIVESDRCVRELKTIAIPEKPDINALSGKIEELNTRIGKGETVLAQVSDIEHARKAYEEWKEKKALLEARVERLERLIDYFGPKGIKTKMIGDKIGPFCEAMNKTLHRYGYDIVGLSLEPYEFRISRDHLPGNLSPRQLSKSEALRFSIAFQIALAMTTGVKFVVIDEADMLVGSNRNILTATLRESDLDQAIVLCSTDKPTPKELPEGVKFVVLGEQPVAA